MNPLRWFVTETYRDGGMVTYGFHSKLAARAQMKLMQQAHPARAYTLTDKPCDIL